MQQNKPVRRGASPQMIVGLLAGLYGLMPFDAIPDFLPGIGQADDVVVIILALFLMLAMTMMGGNSRE